MLTGNDCISQQKNCYSHRKTIWGLTLAGWRGYKPLSQSKSFNITIRRSSATAEIARDANVEAHSLSLYSNLSPVRNLRPLNSSTQYLFIIIGDWFFA